MAKKKIKETANKKSKKYRLSKPEEIFFGFLVIVSIFFGVFCFASVKQIPEVIPSKIYHKPISSMDRNIDRMVQGYPIKSMVTFISRQNDDVAAYLVAIAKKESNWGIYSPKKDGQECYNYWGYRGPENPTTSGYSCFSSPKEAVDIVGDRIRSLIAEKINTPQEMVIWKCGPGCTRRESRSADKWVRDVGFYYNRVTMYE